MLVLCFSQFPVCQEMAVNDLLHSVTSRQNGSVGVPCKVKCVQGVLRCSVDLGRLGACQCQRANCPHSTQKDQKYNCVLISESPECTCAFIESTGKAVKIKDCK